MNTLGETIPMLPQTRQRDYVFLLEGLEMAMHQDQLKRVTDDWNNGIEIEVIAENEKRNPIEVMLALMHQANKGHKLRPFAVRRFAKQEDAELIKYTIQGQLPTSNEIIAASKSHYMVYANMKKDYTALSMIPALEIPVIKKKADLSITWIRKDRRTDPDNISGGIKFLLDGLVKSGKLENDGWDQINTITHAYAVDKDNPRVEVTIKQLDS